ncbi:thioredoxin family protein [Bacillus sp. FJAT-45037]|uniref:thioredoxin family protein n=1 Tax=Bacillus sp. FJAT-45037 TaxID=2011007 RepID=UPI000C24209D|nr:thioredoxin family protein [Bacillus sp. FJAT-45037]
MKELTTIDQVDTFTKDHEFSFIYISRTNCGVCHALLPQVKDMLSRYPLIQQGYVNADKLEEIAGKLSIFTVPVMIFFIDGHEYLREARFVHVEELERKINKLYSIHSED